MATRRTARKRAGASKAASTGHRKATQKPAKAPGTKAKAAEPKPPTHKDPVVDRRRDERRARVLELWGKTDRHIAKRLLEEGYQVDSGEQPLTPHLVREWQLRRQEAMRRNVCNDREHWREHWKKAKPNAKLAPEDAAVERESHVAALKSDIDEIQEILDDLAVKPTAKAMLIGERRQSRVAIAKARGIETLERDDGEDGSEGGPRVRKVLVLDISRCDASEKAKYGLPGS